MITIRKGIETDIPQALTLIKELALYEKAPEQVIVDEAYMLKEGFSDQPSFWFYVAEENELILGIALCYYRYSTWKGKRLYLEDLIVNEKYRNKGIGKLLFEEVLAQAKAEKLSGVVWQVLDWNEPAIHFYKKYNAHLDGEWVNCSIEIADKV
jgi:ribosomal protein S18 acetylase RimI-like enzyme